ncbi:diphosphomevalonate/mevalonate 3,5-bisphosphate decarboxylase family protein [Legionella jordanis]|uniref:Mevalonate diphosphate decarboxylase n=1 Tax=Legionella jordanis TaxID=456 RepID=A0A0W0VBH6_9GAMM|nr:diphosphomevalonate decarboxylase [Legionella jordanis]KTD17484.1 mevalonate diphosphate decarboxylase [Legionella jordanis]RMX05176.1 diphosphomevalonate decarboxylase [Legionella jordanis]RMX17432.1 diphosphomevalonate decarboxylase [Legionella jordanis]VEH13453.1 mevalonate diphosphate decarboxylase [Legionella jordanis]HAT8714372.1 diphosphomevalonate decarboxylase [Legionella jordanis]
MQWFSQAPSNIALIKYMGKKDDASNLPINPSLSYTLNHLLSSVQLESIAGKKDFWEPLEIPGGASFNLSAAEQNRFLQHLALIKNQFNYTGAFLVRSSNNFPHSSGLASSASSFAALTKCAVLALSELTQKPLPSVEEQAQLSRLGSGSSCRSFFSPWALWHENTVEAVDLPYNNLLHQVIVISHAEKKVSSREAHQRVKTSGHYPTRAQRATENLKVLMTALEMKDWVSAYRICWREFQDMHQLFQSCAEPFTYMTEATQEALQVLQNLWERTGDGPIITMDAGPNIHLLYKPEQTEMALQFKRDYLVGNYDVL